MVFEELARLSGGRRDNEVLEPLLYLCDTDLNSRIALYNIVYPLVHFANLVVYYCQILFGDFAHFLASSNCIINEPASRPAVYLSQFSKTAFHSCSFTSIEQN
jgi:hypothetical protein